MATVIQSFDVKISIIRPYITKNLSDQDGSRISQTTNLKYESLKTLTPQGVKTEEAAISDSEVFDYLKNSINELDQISNDFHDLEKMADEALNKVVFTYDVENPENERIAEAERTIFGYASGSITYSKYQTLLDYEQILNREIQERMVNNGGILDVSA